jgi:hypothetical protein
LFAKIPCSFPCQQGIWEWRRVRVDFAVGHLQSHFANVEIWIKLVAGFYIIVRGLANVEDEISKKTCSFQWLSERWQKIFYLPLGTTNAITTK